MNYHIITLLYTSLSIATLEQHYTVIAINAAITTKQMYSQHTDRLFMSCWNRKISKIPQCSCPLSHNTLLWNITTYTSLQMWVNVGYEIDALWGLRDWFILCIVVWIGLRLFNDDTCPSGHISRPSQIGFFDSYLCSINEDLWWCSVVGINPTLECSHLMTDLNKKLCWIYGLSYQIKESSFSQKLYYASLGDRLKEGLQWVYCVVVITTLLQYCTFQEYMLNGQSLATMLASSWWSSGQVSK